MMECYGTVYICNFEFHDMRKIDTIFESRIFIVKYNMAGLCEFYKFEKFTLNMHTHVHMHAHTYICIYIHMNIFQRKIK